MKRIYFILLIFFFALSTHGQEHSLTFDASQMMSTFGFTDSNGEKRDADYQSILTSSYGVGYRFILKNNMILRVGIGKRNGGANYVYDEMNYSWKLQYADAKLGLGYMFDTGRLRPYLLASGYYGYMVRGLQVLNNEEFNITESEILKPSDYGVIGNIGVNYKIADRVSGYLEAEYMHGLNNIENLSGQNATNRSYGLKLGLSYVLNPEE